MITLSIKRGPGNKSTKAHHTDQAEVKKKLSFLIICCVKWEAKNNINNNLKAVAIKYMPCQQLMLSAKYLTKILNIHTCHVSGNLPSLLNFALINQ